MLVIGSFPLFNGKYINRRPKDLDIIGSKDEMKQFTINRGYSLVRSN
jgi:hypothetical protein